MFSDTGNLSLWLSIFFILMSLCGIFVIYSIIKNKSIENENIDKIIELGKWFIVSVALTLTASIVNDGFREREQDIKEMEVFDKYVNTIALETIDKRKSLCEYFAAVAPKGSILEGWKKYEKIVDGHLDEIKKAEERNAVLDKKIATGIASASEIEEKDRSEEKISTLSQSLISKSDQDIQEWAIIAGADSTLTAASDEVKKVEKLKYPVDIYKKGNSFRTVVGPFLDHNAALIALPEIRKNVRSSSYPVNFKTWCTASETKDGYIECKQ